MDLLRIVSMVLIVFLHSIDHSGVLQNANAGNTRMYFYVRFTYALCQVCVNSYIMLSGYFMITSEFRLNKLVVLWMESSFYSIVLKLLFIVIGRESFSVISLVSCLFPILTGRYWFLTIYVGMYLFSPFLNILIRALNRKQHGLLNLCLFLLMSLWGSIHPSIAGMNSGGGWGLAWFITLYITAAWFRLYYTPNHKPLGWLLSYVGISALIATAQVIAREANIGILQTILANWFRYDSAPTYFMTLCLFVGFLNLRIRSEKLSHCICTVAPMTLGVYLIHAHADVSPWSWEILDLPTKMVSPLFPLLQLGSVLAIFCICTSLDALRKITIGRLENSNRVKVCCEKISRVVSKQINRYITGS